MVPQISIIIDGYEGNFLGSIGNFSFHRLWEYISQAIVSWFLFLLFSFSFIRALCKKCNADEKTKSK